MQLAVNPPKGSVPAGQSMAFAVWRIKSVLALWEDRGPMGLPDRTVFLLRAHKGSCHGKVVSKKLANTVPGHRKLKMGTRKAKDPFKAGYNPMAETDRLRSLSGRFSSSLTG